MAGRATWPLQWGGEGVRGRVREGEGKGKGKRRVGMFYFCLSTTARATCLCLREQFVCGFDGIISYFARCSAWRRASDASSSRRWWSSASLPRTAITRSGEYDPPLPPAPAPAHTPPRPPGDSYHSQWWVWPSCWSKSNAPLVVIPAAFAKTLSPDVVVAAVVYVRRQWCCIADYLHVRSLLLNVAPTITLNVELIVFSRWTRRHVAPPFSGSYANRVVRSRFPTSRLVPPPIRRRTDTVTACV